MEEQILLKTSTFGGFEKKGVLDYIDEMNTRAKEAQEALGRKLDEVSAARDDLSRQVSAFSEKIATLEEQLKDEREKVTQLTGAINTLNSELSLQKRTILEKEGDLRREQEKNRQLQFRAESLEYKSRNYEEATMRVGVVLVEAQEAADRIVGRANEEAGEIRAVSRRSMEAISSEIESFRVDVASLRSSIAGVMTSIAEKLDGLDVSIDEIETRCAALMGSEAALSGEPEQGDALPEEADELLEEPAEAVAPGFF